MNSVICIVFFIECCDKNSHSKLIIKWFSMTMNSDRNKEEIYDAHSNKT